MYGQAEIGRQTETEPMPEVMVEKYFSHHIISSMVNISNKYRQAHLLDEPIMFIWKNKQQSSDFSLACMYHFIVTIHYFAILELPLNAECRSGKNTCLDMTL